MAKVKGKDTIKRYEEILSDLRNKIYKPIYLFMGEEAYYIDKLSDYIASNVLPESEKAFNQTVIYGKDVDSVRPIIETARRFPMMSNYQVLIVREAQDLKRIEDLSVYVQKPLKSTILVICYKGKSVDKRTAFYKSMSKNAEVLETARLYDNEIAGWITRYIGQHNFDIEPNAAFVLAEYLGNDLSKIANELNKLFTMLPENRKKITAADVEENIGISKDYNTFELGKAISNRDALRAHRIADHFGKNSKEYPFVLTISALYSQFSKMLKFYALKQRRSNSGEIAAALGISPFFIRDYEAAARNYSLAQIINAIALLREYDMKSKGFNYVAANDAELLRELVSKLMN